MDPPILLLLVSVALAGFVDADDDGFGDPATEGDCEGSALCADVAGDCDDGDAAVSPDGVEIPGDGIDQDCDGHEACFEDLDGDGFGTEVVVQDADDDCDNASSPTASRAGDCDDDPVTGLTVSPLADEVCNGVDDNCDGRVDEVRSADASTWYRDEDGDGYGDDAQRLLACGAPVGWAAEAGDCDDLEPRAFPDATEVCDGIDDDCDGETDEDEAIDAIGWLQDADGDGLGNCSVRQVACEAPRTGGDWVAEGGPCAPDDTSIPLPPRCGCDQSGRTGLGPLLALLAAVGLRRRRR